MTLQVKPEDLRLADVVLLESIHAYHTATVRKIEGLTGTNGQLEITLFRPYVSTADFSMGAGPNGNQVICYIGIEDWKIYPRAGETFTVLERKELK